MDSETSMDTQLLLYDIPHYGADVIAKPSKGNTVSFPDLPELDPRLETTHNLQDLINSTILDSSNLTTAPGHQFLGTDDVLFPELLQHMQAQEATEQTEEVGADSVRVVAEPMPEVSESCSFPDNQASQSQVIILSPVELASLGSQLGIDSLLKVHVAGNEEVFVEAGLPEPKVEELTSEKVTHRNPLKAEAPSKTATRRNRGLEKNSEEYRQRRERNNVAVRKSRDKAKSRQVDTEQRMSVLTEENEKLQKKVDLLTKELTVLKGLFTNVGADLPQKLAMLLEK